MRLVFLFSTMLLLMGMASCKKEHSYSCEELKDAVANDKTDQVCAIVRSYIFGMHSQRYTENNLDQLAQTIAQCDISASIPCFDCVKTLPSQTEMVIAFVYNGVQIQRTIAFSYSKSNQIIIRGMHI